VGLPSDPRRTTQGKNLDFGIQYPKGHRAEAQARSKARHLEPVHAQPGSVDRRLRSLHSRIEQDEAPSGPLLHRPPLPSSHDGWRATNLRWCAQIARNLSEARESRSTPLRFLVHNRDKRFGAMFDEVFKAEGVEIIRTPWRPARANAYAERFVRTDRVPGSDLCHERTPSRIGAQHLRPPLQPEGCHDSVGPFALVRPVPPDR
jgi:hypothetical protein